MHHFRTTYCGTSEIMTFVSMRRSQKGWNDTPCLSDVVSNSHLHVSSHYCNKRCARTVEKAGRGDCPGAPLDKAVPLREKTLDDLLEFLQDVGLRES